MINWKTSAYAGLIALGLFTTGEANAMCGMSMREMPARPNIQVRPNDPNAVAASSDRVVNKAARVALMRQGTRTVLSMSVDYDGPAENFAMVIPVPIVLQQANVKTLPMNVFDRLEISTAPRLIEQWEANPCPMLARPASRGMVTTNAVGGGAAMTAAPRSVPPQNLGVRIEAQFTVGEYVIQVLSATESSGLETWLNQNHYNVPQGASEALAPYVREQWKFFVAKVDITKAQTRPDGGMRLSPLRFHYDSPDFRLPVRLGLLNAPDAQELMVYVLSPNKRFETANYRNVFVPTNLVVHDLVGRNFRTFYAELFDAALHAAGDRAVITEYVGSVTRGDANNPQPIVAAEFSILGGDALIGPVPTDFVVSRLHTRYSRATLSEDLVFREANPVQGGNDAFDDSGHEKVARVTVNGTNSFRARYAIRHAWSGGITCGNPRRGQWSNTPPGSAGPQPGAVALNLGDAARTGVPLASVLRTNVPSLRLTGQAPANPYQNNPANPQPRVPVRIQIHGRVDNATAPQSSSWAWLTGGALSMFGLAFLSRRRNSR